MVTTLPSNLTIRPQAALAVLQPAGRPNPLGQLLPEEVADLADSGHGLLVENPIPDEDLNRMAASGKLTAADQDKLAGLARQARTQHRSLHQKLREGDKSVGASLADLHIFLENYQRSQDTGEFRIYQQAVGEQMGTSDNVAAALFHGLDETNEGIKATGERLSGLAKGNKSILIAGNQVEVLVRGSIWQKKLHLLDEAIASAKAGKPLEIDLQYYELSSQPLLEKVAQAAKAGCPVRVNMDPGRLEKEPESRSFNANELPRKMRTLFQLLSDTAGTDASVTLFPVAKQLGNTENLMHRKLFRVGDTVLLGGINASASSGDNVDSAMVIQGPASKKLVELYRRDMAASAGAELQDVYGSRQLATLQAGNAVLGPAGLMALWENSRFLDQGKFPQLAATPAEHVAQHGQDMARLVQLQDLNEDGKTDMADLQTFLERGIQRGNFLHVTPEGADKLLKMLGAGVSKAQDADNVKRARQVSDASGEVKGNSSLALGDLPADREAIVLHAIKTAEKFLYMPNFVMTRAVAQAVAQRVAEKPDLDVRVIADAGVYPDGHTPNDQGMRALEDLGVQTRWSMLMAPVPGQDRKLHQKAIITEKMALIGSTNMSRKGLVENWELSGLLQFSAEQDANRDTLVSDFQRTFEEEAIDLDSRAIASARLEGLKAKDLNVRIEEARYGVTRDILAAIGAYEMASTGVLAELADATPGVREAAEKLHQDGVPLGYSLQAALRDKLGAEKLLAELRQTPAYQDILRLQKGERLSNGPEVTAEE